MKKLVLAAATIAACMAAESANAAKYLVTWEGAGARGSNYCGETVSSCAQLPYMAHNTPFKAQLTFDDAFGSSWMPDGSAFWNYGTFSNVQFTFGARTFSNITVANDSLSIYPEPDTGLDLTTTFDGTMNVDFWDEPITYFFDMGEFRSYDTLLTPFDPVLAGTGNARLLLVLDFDHYRIDISSVAIEALPMSAVPEPAVWTMMIAGFGLAGSVLRRRRLQTA